MKLQITKNCLYSLIMSNFSIDRIQRMLFIFVVVLTVFFLFYPVYLPMADLPQHAAQVSTLDDLLKNRSPWEDMLQINWRTPYLVIYGIWLFLYQFMDITWSAKTVVVLIFLLYVYAIRQLRREFSGVGRIFDWVALTCFFGLTFQWGFISYLGGIPIGILFFIKNKRWMENKNKKDFIGIFIFGIISYFCHILSFSFFCLISYCYFLSKYYSFSWKQRIIFSIPYLIFAGLLLNYVTMPNPIPFRYYEVEYIQKGMLEKTKELFYAPWNMAFIDYYDIASVLIYISPALLGYKMSREKSRYVPLFISLLVWYIMPYFAHQTAVLYNRFSLFIPIFYYLIWDECKDLSIFRINIKQISSLFFSLSIAAYMFKVYDNNIKFNQSENVTGFIFIKNNMDNNKRELSIYEPDSQTDGNLTSNYELLHLTKWYQAEKKGWSDYSFASAHAMPVRLNMKSLYPGYGKNRFLVPEILESMNCSYYDYIIFRSFKYNENEISNLLNNNKSCNTFKFLVKRKGWILFRNVKNRNNI